MSRLVTADLIDHALSLIAQADVEPPEKAARIRDDLDRWRSESAVHMSAHEEALRRWTALAGALPGMRKHFAEPKVNRKLGTRGMLSIAVIVVMFAAASTWYLRQPTFQQAYHSGTGQIGKLTLPDGSRIDLNAQSAVQVRLYRSQRVVELSSGEARFEVRPDPSKPFQVHTRTGVIEVIGTVFSVSDRGSRILIEVEIGRVRFRPGGEKSVLELGGGERLLARDDIPIKIERYNVRERAEWRNGWLVFDNEALADALLSINPYRKSPIRLADDKTGRLRLTGRFRAGDSQSLLTA
jgi:transmembrane sensor